jgi:flagellin
VALVLDRVTARGASRQLSLASTGSEPSGERIASGRPPHLAANPAADLTLSSRLGADLRLANQGRRNAHEGVSYLQVADAALENVTSLLTRASELAQKAAAGRAPNPTSIDGEFQDIIKGIAAIGLGTTFNSRSIFDASTRLTVAVPNGSPIGVVVGPIASSATAALGLAVGVTSVSTQADAAAAADLVRTAIDSVNSLRATLDATRRQLNSVADALGIQVENFTGAHARIGDASLADEVIQLAKFQILNQSGPVALSLDDQSPHSILALLR